MAMTSWMAYEWKNSALGPKEGWPKILEASVNFVLSSKHPVLLLWGVSHICIYNDLCVPLFGSQAFGQHGRQAIGAWNKIDHLVSEVYAGKMACAHDMLWTTIQDGILAELYISCSCSPIWHMDGTVIGALITLTDTTTRVVSDGRLRLLKTLAACKGISTQRERIELTATSLSESYVQHDLPFTAIYLYSKVANSLSLMIKSGFVGEHAAIPTRISLHNSIWPIKEVIGCSTMVVEDLKRKFGILPGWPEMPETAVVLPICSGADELVGVMIAGINPRRRFNNEYRIYLNLVAEHILPLLDKNISQMDKLSLGLNSESIQQPYVFLVDENHETRQYVYEVLASCYRVEVLDSSKALELMVKELPDLIMSSASADVGHKFLTAVKESPHLSQIPFIIMTTEEAMPSIPDIADDYLVKPFGERELLSRVRSHVQASKLLKQAHQYLLEKNENNYRYMFDSLPIGIFEQNISGEIKVYNRAWKDLLGYFDGRPNVIRAGNDWVECFHPEDRLKVEDAMKFTHKTGKTTNLEARILRSGCVKRVFIDYNPMYSAAGRAEGGCGTIIDVTERQRILQEAFTERGTLLREADEQRKRHELFIDMVCHEIRNPINGIQNNVELLRAGLKTREDILLNLPANIPVTTLSDHILLEREAIESILTCTKQQRAVADDVLNVSTLESGKLVLNDVAFNPRKLIERVKNAFSAEARTKQIQINEIVPKVDIFIYGDPDRLTQVMFNLVTNAIKFTEKCSVKTITLSLEATPQSTQTHAMLKFAVEDTGLGMTQNEQVALFKRFSQANVHTYREYGGSGLGLFISKGIIELMGGNIKVSSTKYQGTNFSFTAKFKLASFDEAKIAGNPSPEIEPRPQLSPKSMLHILIAEDDSVNQKVLKRHMEQAGHMCMVADNGQAALDLMKVQRFDLIFMDMEMPIMGGLAATKAIRREEEKYGLPGIRIIGLSGNARPEYLKIALEAGMDNYIVKPFEKTDLLAKIQKLFAVPSSEA